MQTWYFYPFVQKKPFYTVPLSGNGSSEFIFCTYERLESGNGNDMHSL